MNEMSEIPTFVMGDRPVPPLPEWAMGSEKSSLETMTPEEFMGLLVSWYTMRSW